ncbi:ABC transporter permease [Bradyrhizobium sp. NAS80.1]|uniref:branched-chain amino acid ABC transporter permease n=1 Tax=Bradyrhizobium sp. NAS80.1 TaxID=1680159 RepID=UPI0009674DAD|nr:branched-chain amino acid ABC transporter permease [Bradyrhizobium sp. NAS80.1]OKO84423.1 ABC transporter permease [Bradyrhizobium sp. NAS80.1]
MVDFLQFLVAGLSQGAIYALVGLGFSVIYRATHIVNFAQGEFVMIGGLGTAGALSFALPMPLAILSALVAGCVAALVLDLIVIRLARFAPALLLIIVTIGASVALRGAAQLAWGRNFHSIPSPFGSEPLHVYGVAIMPQVILILVTTVGAVVGLQWFFRRTRFGQAMLAAAINPTAASLVGIELRHVYTATFLIAGLLGMIAGLLITPLAMVHFESGLAFSLKGFAAAILGGLGSVPGVVAGGLLLGVVESLSAGYVSSAYKDAIAFLLIIVVLLTRPEGVFGRRSTGRV